MITREADYALRTILYLAKHKKNKQTQPVSVNVIAEEMRIPYRFLRRISRALQSNGLIVCRRGKNGGMLLARELNKISLYEVIDCINPQALKLNLCLFDDQRCFRDTNCPIHFAMQQLREKLDNEMTKITFDKLV